MKLTILGNNGPYPGAGGACSGYLISEGGTKILIDCGNGVLSNLQRFTGFGDLDAILLTHLHSDHISDMMVLKYALQVKMNRGSIKKAMKVFAPAEPAGEYSRLDVRGVFDLMAIDEELKLKFGSLNISFREMKHPYKCYGIGISSGPKRFVFSGDTSWTGSIVDFSRGADLVMLDAGLLSRDKTNEDVPHLTARECGMIAVEAAAKRLMLTHFWPEYDISELLAEAREYFPGAEASKLLEEYEI